MVNKKVRMTALISLGFLTFCSLLVNKANTVKAEDKVTETASYTDMIVRTALNNGEMYTGGKLADYSIVHGKVSTNSISKFTTCVGNASSWTGSLGTTSDNAFATNGQINTLNDDGVIAKMTAKEDIEININRTTKLGWEDPCILGIYKEDSKGIETQVRGVDSSSSVSGLLEKGLIEEAGRLDLPGRPVSFRTTDTFLRVFGLSSLADLPPVHSDAPADDPTESEG